MSANLSQEVQLVRETLDNYLAPAMVGKVMYAALRLCPSPPKTREGVRYLVGEAMPVALGTIVDEDERDAIVDRLRWLFFEGPASHPPPPRAPATASGLEDLEIDVIEDEDEDREVTITRMMPTSRENPVPVLIVTSDVHFGSFLEASLGFHRIHAANATTLAEMARSLTNEEPLVFIVDAVSPATCTTEEVTAAIKGLPATVVVVVWGRDTEYGAPISDACTGLDRRVLLAADEGLDPLFDLVTSRYGA